MGLRGEDGRYTSGDGKKNRRGGLKMEKNGWKELILLVLTAYKDRHLIINTKETTTNSQLLT